jgi:single-stranded DNA-binding protein
MPNSLSLVKKIKTPTDLGDLQMAEGTLVSVTGHIGKNPESRQAGSKLVCSCSVAVSWGKGDDRKTVWVNVDGWEDMAELLADFSKGDAICVTGPRKSREYQDKTYWSINAWDIARPCYRKQSGAPTPARDAGSADDGSEIPF